MALQAVLLDLDGTVWDSFPWYAQIVAEETGYPRGDLLEELRHGGNIISLTRMQGISPSRFAKLCKLQAENLALFPGVRAGIEGLASQNTPMAAVSNLPRRLAGPMLVGTNLRGFFSETTYAAGKPSPSAILTALGNLGVVPGPDCLYVGDQRVDAECARRAGISFAWASYGYAVDHPEPSAPALSRLDELLQL